jgi:PAS domain S-box-containing protein
MTHSVKQRAASAAHETSSDELKRTVHLLREALDANEDTIFVKDLDDRYLFVNVAGTRRFNRPLSELMGRDATAVFDPENANRLRDLDFQVMETGQPNKSERTLSVSGGPPRIFLASRAPYRDAEGKIIGVIGVSREVTEQRRLEELSDQSREQIAHLSRVASVGEMASTLAHELNQPLTAILSYAGVCLNMVKADAPSKSNAELAEYLGELCKEANRAATIIRRMRAYLHKEHTSHLRQDIQRPVEEALELMRHVLQRAGVKPKLEFADDLPEVNADSIQVQQVLINLIQNALDSMDDLDPAERRLTVRTDLTQDGEVRVRVIDGGAGVPAENLGKIFESYFTTKPNGLGLGLPICRSIVESHGGRLSAAVNPDGGMTFEFSLPSADRS